MTSGSRLQPMVRARVARLDEAGARWVDRLPDLLDELEDRWDVVIERRSLPGGSASLVAPARTAGGEERAVKVAVPGVDLTREAAVLAAAAGRGHVLLHGVDADRQALLMERLGTSLEQTPMPVEDALDLMAAALREAWHTPLSAVPAARPGADRATLLRDTLVGWSSRSGHEATPAVLARALEYAERRAAAYDPDACVVAHGDPHPANLLRVRSPRPGAASGWALVDPDGVRAEPAYDVGVALRDWSSQLVDRGAPARLRTWCERLAAATGQDPQVVWEWAFLERVSTGLYVTSFGAPAVGRPFLRSAALLID